MKVSDPRAVCILGMHRSGTSALARALQLAGVYLGHADEMMPAAADNPKGFYEHSQIVAIQESLLSTLGRSWDCSTAMPENWWTFPEVQPIKERLRLIVKSRFGGHPVWGWKDPRTCLTLPLWQQVLEEEGCRVSYVIIFRNPPDIARSLHRRNRFNPNKSQALFALHNLYALHYTRGTKRIGVLYDTLLHNCRREILRIFEGLDLPGPDEDSLSRIEEWIDPEMSNGHDHNLESAFNLSPVVRKLWALTRNTGNIDAETSVKKAEDLLLSYESYSRLIETQCVENPVNIAEVYDYSSNDAARERSVSCHIPNDGKLREYAFEIPWKNCSLLRFDPGGAKGMIEIDSMELWAGSGNGHSRQLLHRYDRDELKLGEGLVEIENGRSLRLLASHDDPQILMPVAPASSAAEELLLKVRMGVSNSVTGDDLSETGRFMERSARAFTKVQQQLEGARADAGQAHLSRKETELKLEEAGKCLKAVRTDLEEAGRCLRETKQDLLRTGRHIAAWRHEIGYLINELDGFKQEPELIARDFEDVESAVYEILDVILDALRFKRFVVSISHSDYTKSLGGTEKFIREEQADLADRGISYIQLSPYGSVERPIWQRDWNPLLVMNVDSQPLGTHTASFAANMFKLLSESGLAQAAAVHIHHLLRWSLPAIGLLRESLGASKTRFYLHDYHSICSQYNLLKNDNTYCGGPGNTVADRQSPCLDCSYAADREKHAAAFRGLLSAEEIEIIAPSKSAASVWTSEYSEWRDRVRVVPHQVIEEENSGKPNRLERLSSRSYPPRIAYVGYQAVNKGWQVWERVFSDAKLKKKYDFYTLGACYRPPKHLKHVPVSFVQDGPDAMIQALKDHEIDVAFLWSIWPETYSYTLFESLAANCLVITNPISGNIFRTVHDSQRGLVLENEDAVQAFFRDIRAVKEAIARNLKGNRYKRLIPNDVIAEETANLIGGERNLLEADVSEIRRYARDNRREAILDKLVMEKVRAETIARNAERLDYLEQVFHYYRTHWTYRAVESAKRKSMSLSEKHPALAKPTGFVLRNLSRLVS